MIVIHDRRHVIQFLAFIAHYMKRSLSDKKIRKIMKRLISSFLEATVLTLNCQLNLVFTRPLIM
ncbi:MAG: hypothetical protein CMP10_18400 [Zetaproteobacteria bacterium]|nr:hypothetical protein [Pseudobdellovibrionaceae bacterium]